MGFRFRKSIKILPGLKVNLSNGSPSLTLGKRGMSVTMGKNGTYGNVGLPGSGLSYRTRLDRPAAKVNGGNANHVDLSSLYSAAAEYNAICDSISKIHTLAPDLSLSPHDEEQVYLEYRNLKLKSFGLPEPVRPVKPEPSLLPAKPEASDVGLLTRWFGSKEDKLSSMIADWQNQVNHILKEDEFQLQDYAQRRTAWAQEYAQWKSAKESYDAKKDNLLTELPSMFATDNDFFEHRLMEHLAGVNWPHETNVSAMVNLSQSTIYIDVDLPEVEDIPQESAVVKVKKADIEYKKNSDKDIRLSYSMYVHGIILRVILESLYVLPFNTIKVSGYTQRFSASTGVLGDEYILACVAERSDVESMSKSKIDSMTPEDVLMTMGLKRKMTKTGIFKPIEPILAQ